MNVRSIAFASSLAVLTSVGASLAQPPDPERPAPTRVRPTLDIDGTHVVEMALYGLPLSEAFDTGITVTGFRADGCELAVTETGRARRGDTTTIALGVHATSACTAENRDRDVSFTAFLGGLRAGHYEVALGTLTLPFDVAPRLAVADEWAVRLAVAQRYRDIGVHACGMPPYYHDALLFPEQLERFRREHADAWAWALELGRRAYPPAPEEEAARLVAVGASLDVKPGAGGAWEFAFSSRSCCSQTTTRGTATVRGGVVALPDDAQLRHETVTQEGCKESDFPV